jgi:hypothetical protein
MSAMKKLIESMVLALLLLSACSKEDRSGWFVDESFSVKLVTSWGNPPIINQQDPASTVDVLQIFRVPYDNARLFTVDEIRSQQLVYETDNSADIVQLFRAARHQTADHCDSAVTTFVLFILAFDRDLMRVGILKYYPCTEKQSPLGTLQPWGSNSIWSSYEFAKTMNQMIPSSVQRGYDKAEKP